VKQVEALPLVTSCGEQKINFDNSKTIVVFFTLLILVSLLLHGALFSHAYIKEEKSSFFLARNPRNFSVKIPEMRNAIGSEH
jgi:hypothetical protein